MLEVELPKFLTHCAYSHTHRVTKTVSLSLYQSGPWYFYKTLGIRICNKSKKIVFHGHLFIAPNNQQVCELTQGIGGLFLSCLWFELIKRTASFKK